MGNTFANHIANKQLLRSTLNTNNEIYDCPSRGLVLAVCQIDAYPQPIFFPGGSGAGFGGGNAGPFGASGYGVGVSNAYNGGFSSGYGNGFGSTSPFGFNAGGNGNSFSYGR